MSAGQMLRAARTERGLSLDDLADVLAYLRASREAEPAPPMSAALLDQLAAEA